MAYTAAQIETALIARLAPLKASQGVRRIVSHPGVIKDQADLAETGLLTPAVYVRLAGSSWAGAGPRKIETLSFEILAVERDHAAPQAAWDRAWALLEAARGLLYGHRLGLEVLPLALVRQEPAFGEKGLAALKAIYRLGQAHLYPAT